MICVIRCWKIHSDFYWSSVVGNHTMIIIVGKPFAENEPGIKFDNFLRLYSWKIFKKF